MTDELAELTRRTGLLEGALARGQAALVAGDKKEAVRWLDRARRLSPADGTIALFLASALIGDDNARAAQVFADVLKTTDVRDAWLGLATARFLTGDLVGAHKALAETLSRHALKPDMHNLAERVVRTVGAPGWCGLTGEGVVVLDPAGPERIEMQIDSIPVDAVDLPSDWPRGEWLTVTAAGRHLIGSPVSLRSIGRTDGYAEAGPHGVHGWAWHPGDPDRDPCLTIAAGRFRRIIRATQPGEGVGGLPPLARPRSFNLAWADLPPEETRFRLFGRDGRDIPGSPVFKGRVGIANTKPVSAELARRRDLKRWSTLSQGTAVLVTHNDGGGVEKRIQVSIATHLANGRRAIVLRPAKAPNGAIVITVDGDRYPGLRFELPREQPALLRLLRETAPVKVELHHLLNHDPAVVQTIRALGIPYDVHTHDFAWFCPRIALIGGGDRYCGEPSPDMCEICVAENGSYLHEDISVADLLKRSQDILAGARLVIAPSSDAADRMARHFPGLSPTVVPHENDGEIDEPPPIPIVTGPVRICVAGAIGLHKGFHVVLACARDARERGLDLSFVVAGTTIDDQRLIDTGRVFVTGPYQPHEAVALIRAQNAAMALLPSIWPETWCLGLTELWRAGLRVAAFDLGAPAERIRACGRGFLLPLGLEPSKINDVLLNAAKGRSFLPIRHTSAYKPCH
jgi:glycosyltransferase involved in cell wall biosynthesis